MVLRFSATAMAFAFSAIIASSTLANAQEPDCGAAETQAEMNRCAADAYEAADVRLNASYSALMERFADNADGRKALRAAQRAWIAFRDAECDFATSSSRGGSIYPLLMAECRRVLTETRTEQLDGYRQCEEGDLTCP